LNGASSFNASAVETLYGSAGPEMIAQNYPYGLKQVGRSALFTQRMDSIAFCKLLSRAVAGLCISTMIMSCDRDNLSQQPNDSLIPPQIWKHLGSKSDKVCVERAYREIKTTGRTYHFLKQSGVDESIKDIWIGAQLFRIPEQYIVRVNNGSGWHLETPGMNVWIQAWMPDMRFSFKDDPRPREKDTEVQIHLTCTPTHTIKTLYKQIQEDEAASEKLRPSQFRHFIPELGLDGKSKFNEPTSTVTYFPANAEVKNFNGMPLRIDCGARYPVKKSVNSVAIYCGSSFMLRDGISVGYSFKESQLPQWRSINEQVINLVQSLLVEGK
jgi:hypothetical protein